MRAAPELVAVALQPIVLFVRAARLGGCGLLDLERRRLFDPLGGQQRPAFPDALLQIQLPKLSALGHKFDDVFW